MHMRRLEGGQTTGVDANLRTADTSEQSRPPRSRVRVTGRRTHEWPRHYKDRPEANVAVGFGRDPSPRVVQQSRYADDVGAHVS